MRATFPRTMLLMALMTGASIALSLAALSLSSLAIYNVFSVAFAERPVSERDLVDNECGTEPDRLTNLVYHLPGHPCG